MKGNGEDLGSIAGYAFDLSRSLQANVFIYDYSGYGISDGKPTEGNCYSDIRAAFQYLVTEKRIAPRRIVLIGRSLGSGPTIDIAASLGKNCGGVIIISGLCSCLRIALGDMYRSPRFDMFRNIDKVQKIVVPIFFTHGKLDKVVPIGHGIALCQKSKYPLLPLWVKDASHNNLESTRFKDQVFSRYSEVLVEFSRWQGSTILVEK